MCVFLFSSLSEEKVVMLVLGSGDEPWVTEVSLVLFCKSWFPMSFIGSISEQQIAQAELGAV